MRCPDCGKRNPDSRKFCQECGKNLENVRLRAQNVEYVCSSCGAKGTKKDKFCGVCGAEMPILLPWLDEDEEARMREKIAEYRACLELIEGASDAICYRDRYESLDAELSEIKLDMEKYVPRFDRRWRSAAAKIREEKRRLKSRGDAVTSEDSKFKSILMLLFAAVGIPLVTAVLSVMVNLYLPGTAGKYVTVATVVLGWGALAAALYFLGVPRLVRINEVLSFIGGAVAIVFAFIPVLRISGIAIFAAIFASSAVLFLIQLKDKATCTIGDDTGYGTFTQSVRLRLTSYDVRLSVSLAAFAFVFALWSVESYAFFSYGKGPFFYIAYAAAFILSTVALFLTASFKLIWNKPLFVTVYVLNVLATLVFGIIISGPAIFAIGITVGLFFYMMCVVLAQAD